MGAMCGPTSGVSFGFPRGLGRYHPAMPEVRTVRPEDVPAAAASLVRAFFEDPVLAYMFPNPRTRGKALGRFFRFQLRRTYLTRGMAYMTEECHSIALWLPPKSSQLGIRDVLAQRAHAPYPRAEGRRSPAARPARRISSPRTAHYYLGGSAPSSVAGQGARLGRAASGSRKLRPGRDACLPRVSKEKQHPLLQAARIRAHRLGDRPGRTGPAVAHVAGASGTALGLADAVGRHRRQAFGILAGSKTTSVSRSSTARAGAEGKPVARSNDADEPAGNLGDLHERPAVEEIVRHSGRREDRVPSPRTSKSR